MIDKIEDLMFEKLLTYQNISVQSGWYIIIITIIANSHLPISEWPSVSIKRPLGAASQPPL